MDQNDTLLDISVLATLSAAIGPEKQRDFIKTFMHDMEERSLIMHAAYDEQRWQNVEEQAHILTSSAGTYGATALQHTAAQIEKYCENNTYDELSTIMADDFAKLIAQTRYALQCYLQQLTA